MKGTHRHRKQTHGHWRGKGGCASNMMVVFVVQLLICVLLCDCMDYSMPDSLSFTLSQSLLKFMSIDLGCYLTISASAAPFFCLQYFPISQLFASDDQSIGALASASVFLVNIEGWYPLWLTGLILLSKGLLRVFSKTIAWTPNMVLQINDNLKKRI